MSSTVGWATRLGVVVIFDKPRLSAIRVMLSAIFGAGVSGVERTAAKKVLSRLDVAWHDRRSVEDIAPDECVIVVVGNDLDAVANIMRRCKNARIVGLGVLASKPTRKILTDLQVRVSSPPSCRTPPVTPHGSYLKHTMRITTFCAGGRSSGFLGLYPGHFWCTCAKPRAVLASCCCVVSCLSCTSVLQDVHVYG